LIDCRTYLSEILAMNTLTQPSSWRQLCSPLLVLLVPTLAHAHVGVGHASGLAAGLAHPLSGLDHLAAMIGVGLWAAQRGGRALWLVPLVFVLVMWAGGILGIAGVAIPLVEPGIIASLLVIGVLVAAAVRLPLVASVLIVGLFALVHGHAHGAEMPDTAAGMMYGVGFLVSTGLLLLAGIGCGALAQRIGTTSLVRYAGGAIALLGVYLCVS
jgi:urease accessory protein